MRGMVSALLVSVSMMALANAARADVEINNKPTGNMSCDAGVCTATAQKAVLNVGDLATMLAAGDVAVKTGSLAKDIDIDQPLQWTSTTRLTLDAQQSVTIEKQVTVAGQGALTVTTNDSGGAKAKSKTGEFIIVPERGSVQFWDLSSSLIVDGNSYTLVGDIKTLASDIAANPSGFYALARPYDASADGTYETSPIQTTFTGTFEGLGNNISNLKADVSHASIGLFSRIDPSGIVRDICVTDIDFEGRPASGVGGLVALNVGLIERSLATGTIKLQISEFNSGGLVAANFGFIVGSHSKIRLTVNRGAAANAGQLVGENDGTVASSYASGSVVGKNVGSSNFGGLVGLEKGLIDNSYAVAAVKDGRQNCCEVGGLVGENDTSGVVQRSYATGEITIVNGMSEVGGLIGFDGAASGSIVHSYWNLDKGVSNPHQGAGNIEDDPGITGLTTRQLLSQLPKGFDPKIWGQNPKINKGFPFLLSNPPK